MAVGIEAISVYAGRACLDVRRLSQARGLDMRRFDNLMMAEKSVNLPCEDAVTNAVNAAKPLVDALSPAERDRIELLIVGTESGLDFAKPISTYVHEYLELNRNCRSFETKHACYGGTAALQMAACFVRAGAIPGVKALVIAADAASVADRMSYWEPSQGAGAVAMLVSDRPDILNLDPGANGYYTHEVMDTLRPRCDLEAGDTDLSLLSYLEGLDKSFRMYRERVVGTDILTTFDYLVFHAPFAGMVKGAHRVLLRKQGHTRPEVIESDFEARMSPSLIYCARVGNVYSASLYLALCSLIAHAGFEIPRRIGLFSYGSGSASEFYSGVVPAGAPQKLAAFAIGDAIDRRYCLSMSEYESVSDMSVDRMGGVENKVFDTSCYCKIYEACFAGRRLLALSRILNFHREYAWS
jgi:polyketide biosynthesis 3-hydroxy-3-methylglutaryl-CoA synthase-like enzyme PksG